MGCSSMSKLLIFAIFMALTFSSMEVSLAARLLQQSTNPNPSKSDPVDGAGSLPGSQIPKNPSSTHPLPNNLPTNFHIPQYPYFPRYPYPYFPRYPYRYFPQYPYPAHGPIGAGIPASTLPRGTLGSVNPANPNVAAPNTQGLLNKIAFGLL
ncbi:hypothetical protein COLO4_09512 [Corchorus olitorius]|uniref:Uncharacterized protein n=1 Tax=Corchorus olitorius TaxID=93759 RepID=A0A1R3KBW5_9ROSI|nr:hypothetical protein COLO4_09512 [Corchorus olitorius]